MNILLSNANILDLRSGEIHTKKYIVIRNEIIANIFDDIPKFSGEMIDVSKYIVIPGLCDAHVHVKATSVNLDTLHLQSPSYITAKAIKLLQNMLQRGFTTVRDVGGADWGLVKAVEEGIIEGPRIIHGGLALSQTGGHGDGRGSGEDVSDFCYQKPALSRVCDGVTDVRRAVRDEVRKGAKHIKIMGSGGVMSPTDRLDSVQFSDEEILAIVDEANSAKIYVLAHCYTAETINRALKLGVHSIEHGNLLDHSSVELLKEKDAFLVPTLITYQALKEGSEKLSKENNEKLDIVLDGGMKSLELAHNAGIKIVYGTDLLGEMQERQSDEFKIRAEVIPIVDVLRSATITAAELLGLEKYTGVIEKGKYADLLVIDGNPLENIEILTDTSKLKIIMKEGKIFKNIL